MILLSFFKISGHSMEPTIRNGRTVLASNLPYFFRKPKIRDIVAIRQKKSGKILIKRIVEANKGKYILRGDNRNDSFDSKRFGEIGRGDILGKVLVIL